jgi:hypothetical protein
MWGLGLRRRGTSEVYCAGCAALMADLPLPLKEPETGKLLPETELDRAVGDHEVSLGDVIGSVLDDAIDDLQAVGGVA